jgi:hypothetical protein
MTANPKWPEVEEAIPAGTEDRARMDIVARIFQLKLSHLKMLLFKQNFLGKTVAHIFTIEFQKRGLPHVHLIVFFDRAYKLQTPEMVDSAISAEIPDKDSDPELHALVMKYMIHTPCTGNPDAPCQKDGKCSKGFPKPFQVETTMMENSYSSYQRRNTGLHHKLKEYSSFEVDNSWLCPTALPFSRSLPAI